MIKVSVITDEISQDFARALDVALAERVRHVELRTLWEKNVVQLSDDEVEKARACLRERGMKVVAIAGPFFKCFLNNQYRRDSGDTFGYASDQSIEQHFDILDRCFHLAKAFGTDLVRTFAFWRAGPPTQEVYELIARHIGEATRRTEQAGLRLALENEHACFIGTAAESVEALTRVSSPSLGLIWDPGNAACIDPPASVFPHGYELVKNAVGMERIFHMHLKDPVTSGGRGTRFTQFGDGELDYRGQFEALVRDGYQGAVSMETHWRGEGLTPEESTVRSLRGFWRIVKEAGLEAHFE